MILYEILVPTEIGLKPYLGMSYFFDNIFYMKEHFLEVPWVYVVILLGGGAWGPLLAPGLLFWLALFHLDFNRASVNISVSLLRLA